jgi:hypothetical protein
MTRLTDVLEGNILADLVKSQQEKEERIEMYRLYYNGIQDTQLSDRQADFLALPRNDNAEFNANVCPIPVDSLAERLEVTGFDAGDDSTVYDGWWDDNDMDGEQNIVHTAALRDAESYIIVEWDAENNRPIYTFELARVGASGVSVHRNPANRKEVLFASKRWIETAAKNGSASKDVLRRLNIYLPDRIEKFQPISAAKDGGELWEAFIPEVVPEGEQTPVKLPSEILPKTEAGVVWHTTTGTADGEPLGVQVFEFQHNAQGFDGGRSELADVIPLQNLLNKALIDLVAVADTNGFPILLALGDPGVDLELEIGALLGFAKDVKVERVPIADLKKLIEMVDFVTMMVARVTRTPLSFFQTTGQVSSEGTQKQQEAGLVSRAKKAQTAFGNVWEQVMEMSRKMHNAFPVGEDGKPAEKLDENQRITAVWKDPETRNDKEFTERMVMWADKLGVDLPTVWAEMGFSADKIEAMEESPQHQARLAGARQLVTMANREETIEDG